MARRGTALLLALLVLTGCGGGLPQAPPPGPVARIPSGSLPPVRHLFLLVMENLSSRAAMGLSPLRSLLREGESDPRVFATAHPSLPNYLALVAGTTFGIRSDCWFCSVSGENLGSLLSRRHIPWGAYLEGLPVRGFLGPFWPLPFWGYAGKHDPFRYFRDFREPRLRDHLLPLSALWPTLARPSREVPRLLFVVPDLCHDGHSCPPRVAARWLADFVARLSATQAFRDRGLLLVVWDEGRAGDDRSYGPGGRILPTGGGGATLLLAFGPSIPKGRHILTPLPALSILKTAEELFHLPLLGKTRRPWVPDLRALWPRGPAS